MKPANEPHLMRLYMWHCAIGFALSAVFVALLLWFDVAHLYRLVAASDIGALAVFLLWFFHGTIFGSVQFAIHVMSKAVDDDGPRRGLSVPSQVVVRQAAAKRRL